MEKKRTYEFTAMLLVVMTAPLAPVWAQSELDGAWRVTAAQSTYSGVIEDVQPGLYIFQNGYYSVLHVWSEGPRPFYEEGESRDNVTHEKLQAIVVPVEGNSGTYSTDGSAITLSPVVAISPNFMNGGSASYTFKISKDELTLENEDNGRVLKLQRLN